jgi:hypothetical protein
MNSPARDLTIDEFHTNNNCTDADAAGERLDQTRALLLLQTRAGGYSASWPEIVPTACGRGRYGVECLGEVGVDDADVAGESVDGSGAGVSAADEVLCRHDGLAGR